MENIHKELNRKVDWREQAKALFFIDHFTITTIADILQRSRETVSRFICTCEGYDEEMLYRKGQSAERRKESKRRWNQEYRNTITKESLRQEHETAVKILSAEKY